MPDFSILQTPNFAQAALGGYQAGRAIGKQQRVDAALQTYAKNPEAGAHALEAAGEFETAALLRKSAKERRVEDTLSRVFEKQAITPALAPQGAPQAPTPTTPAFSQPGSIATPTGSPLDPAQAAPVAAAPAGPTLPPIDQPLPPRTDGLTINQGALRELYAVDPTAASQIQKFIYDSDESRLKQVTARGEAMAQAATALGGVSPEQRGAEFQKWIPFLLDRGFSQEQLGAVDLSDAGLSRAFTQGRTIEKIVEGKKDERDYDFKREQFGADEAYRAKSLENAGARIDLAERREGRVAGGGIGTGGFEYRVNPSTGQLQRRKAQ